MPLSKALSNTKDRAGTTPVQYPAENECLAAVEELHCYQDYAAEQNYELAAELASSSTVFGNSLIVHFLPMSERIRGNRERKSAPILQRRMEDR